MKRGFSVALSLLYPITLLFILRRYAVPRYAEIGLKLYPVAVSLVIFSVFFKSLYAPQTFIERMARLRNPDMSPQAVAYTRKVTKVWCVFLACNGLAALALALFAPREIWAAYTGAGAYILMGILFGVEFLVRQRVKHAQS